MQTCAVPENSLGWGPDMGFFCMCFLSSAYFTEGPTDLPQEATGPKVSKFLTRRVRTNISKEHIATCDFPGGPDPCPFPPPNTHTIGSAHVQTCLIWKKMFIVSARVKVLEQ